MNGRIRDGALALVALAALLALLAATGSTAALWRPVPALAGVAGALLLELAFLRRPTLGDRWERPAVHAGGLVLVLLTGAATYLLVGPPVVTALCWGLATFLGLLTSVVLTGRNPLAAVLGG